MLLTLIVSPELMLVLTSDIDIGSHAEKNAQC